MSGDKILMGLEEDYIKKNMGILCEYCSLGLPHELHDEYAYRLGFHCNICKKYWSEDGDNALRHLKLHKAKGEGA
jgi:hypothetical protein